MDATVINFKPYQRGALVGFFDLAVGGLVIVGCRAFQKDDDRLWFNFPSELVPGHNGKDDFWKDHVTAAEPVKRHLQGQVRAQLRPLLEGNEFNSNQELNPGPSQGRGQPPRDSFTTPEGEDLSDHYSSTDDDIPF